MFNIFKKSKNNHPILESCKKAIDVLNEYKTPSPIGQFEALICATLVVMQLKSLDSPEQQKLFRALNNSRIDYGLTMSSGNCVDFINSRFQFYHHEIAKVMNSEGYINGAIYSAFYINPGKEDVGFSHDLMNVMVFDASFHQLLQKLQSI